MDQSKPALVLGNGESRKYVDLNSIRHKAIFVGCNAIHRNINVDHLICCDRRMMREFMARKKSKVPYVYTRIGYYKEFVKNLKKNCTVSSLPDLPYSGKFKVDQPDHWGSGPYALLVAANLGVEDIHLVGFDLYAIDNQVNNLYKGTPNYRAEGSPAVDPSFWIYQIRKVFEYFPSINFTVYNLASWNFPAEWKCKNVKYLDIKHLSLSLDLSINKVYTI